MKKYIAIMLVIIFIFTGCQSNNNSQKDKDTSTVKPSFPAPKKIDKKKVLSLSGDIIKAMDKTITSEDMKVLESITDDIDEAKGDAKKLAALMLATDISIGQLGMVSQDMLLYMAGKALKGYPEHPLIVNNAASVLFDVGKTEDAVVLYKEAVKASPQNPIFLCNLANAFIQKGDFSSAEKYARQSLLCDSEYTAAYQILTTVHLERKQDMLAAETMIKSFKNCFNDLSISQFDSFISEAKSLDPEDEFPIKVGILDELYIIAKQDAEEINESIDTPEGQIKVKPFPKYSNIESFMENGREFTTQEQNLFKTMTEAVKKGTQAAADKENYINGSSGNANGKYPVRGSLKQIYAFKIMTSFYRHKFKQETHKLIEQGYDMKNSYLEEGLKLSPILEEKTEEHFKKSEEHTAKAIAHIEADNEAAANAEFAAAAAEAEKVQDCYRKHYENIAKIDADYFRKYYNNKEEIYNKIKQVAEEYWLRSGGLLKYVSDEATFKYLMAERDELIFSEIYGVINGMGTEAEIFKANKEAADSLKKEYVATIYGIGTLDFKPDVEYPPLPKFKEKNDKPREISLPFISASYSNQELTIKVSTPVSNHLWKKSFFDGRYTSASAYGANPAIGALAKAVLGKKGHESLQEKAWKYGINVPDKLHDGKVGQYITRDANGRVVDRGKYNVKESSIPIPGIKGASMDVSHEYMRSFITGVVEVEKSKSIGFTNLRAK